MLVKTVRLSSKGQLTLPAQAMRALRARKGDEFVLVQEGDRIVLIPASKAGKSLLDDLGGWESLAAPAFTELWANEADEVWNEA